MYYFKILKLLENTYKEKVFLLKFNVGDTISVYIKIKDVGKERIQKFEGIVIKMRGFSNTKTFTVRKISDNVGIERTFPFFSPNIVKIELKKKGLVRRSKLYYLRGKYGKFSKVKHKN